MLSCGLLIRGYALFSCSQPGCTHSKKVPFSCKSRFCPTCGKKATDQWIATQQSVLPQTAWQHITFTMPSELWVLFKDDYRLLGQLSALAAGTVQQVARDKGVLPGIFTALHTFGRDLKYNVHIHLSVTLGGLSADHSAWKNLYFPKRKVMPQWRYGVISLLRQAYQADTLKLPPALQAQCPTLSEFNAWLDTHYRKAWIVHFTKPSKNPRHNVNYLGRYLKRPPLAQSRLQHAQRLQLRSSCPAGKPTLASRLRYDGQSVVFEYLNHTTGQHQTRTDAALAFIERFVQHIPDKGFRLIRYYGFLANRVRSAFLPTVYALLDQPAPQPLRLHWPTLLKQSFRLDPLQCLLCHAPLQLRAIVPGLPAPALQRYHWHLAVQKPINV